MLIGGRDRLQDFARFLVMPLLDVRGRHQVLDGSGGIELEAGFQRRESARRLAALEPATCWPGHHGPLTGDVRGTLERIAAE